MPFTLAHAAVVVPMRRLNLIWSAVIVGTFAPDIEYFLRIPDPYRASHEFAGVITFTLPLAVISLYTFHRVLKMPLLELAPDGLRQRLFPCATSFTHGGWRNLPAIIFCLSLGIATHLIWDSFTHRDTWASRRWEWLAQPCCLLGYSTSIPNYDVLQYVSSVLGCAILLGWFLHWYRTDERQQRIPQPLLQRRTRQLLGICMLLLPLSLGLVGAIRLASTLGHLPGPKTLGKYVIYIPGTLMLAETFAFALWASCRRRWLPAPGRSCMVDWSDRSRVESAGKGTKSFD